MATAPCPPGKTDIDEPALFAVVGLTAGSPDLAVLIFPTPAAADAWARQHDLDDYTVVPTRFIATTARPSQIAQPATRTALAVDSVGLAVRRAAGTTAHILSEPTANDL